MFQDKPSGIVKVLSETTRRTDEGEKLEACQKISTLNVYLMFEQAIAGVVGEAAGCFNVKCIQTLQRSFNFLKSMLCCVWPGRLTTMIKNIVVPFKAAFRNPGRDRQWARDQALGPEVTVSGSQLTIKNVRNFRWGKDGRKGVYETRTYDLEKIETAWFALAPFGRTGAMAHVWVSFGFSDGSYVSISVEARRERGESYSAWRGMWRQYEVTYVIADERDVIPLRTHVGDYETYLYPVEAELHKIRGFFKDMVLTADALEKTPTFYHTLWNSCATSLIKHINKITPHRAPRLDLRILFPGYADRLAYRLGLIRSDMDFPSVREAHKIKAKALAAPLDDHWSRAIRSK